MESNTITISQLADLIIVACFFIAGYVSVLYLLGEAISAVMDCIRNKRKARKERKAKELNGQRNRKPDPITGGRGHAPAAALSSEDRI